MILAQQLTTLDTEITQLQALIEAKRQQQEQLAQLDIQTGDALGLIKVCLEDLGKVAPDVIASLKIAVLELFANGDNGTGDDGGNQPTDPTPNRGDDGEIEIIALNGETGDCLTTADLDDPIPDNPVGDEHVLPSARPLAGQSCSINPDLYWAMTTTPDGSTWEFASPLACQLEDCPKSRLVGQSCELATPFGCSINPQLRPLPSPTEMIHLSANCGYLKLKADGRILSAYAWFSRKNVAESWMQQLEVVPNAKVEMRESKRNSSWKWELKITGL
jgi:hypothetical protein